MKRILITCLSLLIPCVGMAQNKFPVPKTGQTIVEEINYLGEKVTIFDLNGDRWDDLWVSTFYSKNPYRDTTVDSDGDGLTDQMEMLNWSDPYKVNPLPKKLTEDEKAIQLVNEGIQKTLNDKEQEKLWRDNKLKNSNILVSEVKPLSIEEKRKKIIELFNKSKHDPQRPEFKPYNRSFVQAYDVKATDVNPPNPPGLTGAGVSIAVVEIDRLDDTHIQLPNASIFMGTDPFYTPWSAGNPGDHATGVAGIIGGSKTPNSAVQGIAENADIFSFPLPINSSIYSDILTNTVASNHSYGVPGGWSDVPESWGGLLYYTWHSLSTVSMVEPNWCGIYDSSARALDGLLYAEPDHIHVKSSGNSRLYTPGIDKRAPGSSHISFERDPAFPNSYLYRKKLVSPGAEPPQAGGDNVDGYDSLIGEALAKNVLTVGATTVEGNLWGHSGIGPTDDGRMKPELVAIGYDVALLKKDNGYGTGSGTSFAGPVVAGVIALLTEAREGLGKPRMKASTMKALLTHTATDMGNPGPDYKHGYGTPNTALAYQVIKDDADYVSNPHIKELYLTGDQEAIFHVMGDRPFFNPSAPPNEDGPEPILQTQPLVITMCWHDKPGTSPGPLMEQLDVNHKTLHNDFDIVVYDEEAPEEFLPWVLNPSLPNQNASKGVNDLDNIEQIVVPNAVPGKKYLVKIQRSPFDTNPNTGTLISLIITGNDPDYEHSKFLKFMIDKLERTGPTEMTIYWTSVPGVKYRVEKSTDLQTWTTIHSNIIANGDNSGFPVQMAGNKLFWRIATED